MALVGLGLAFCLSTQHVTDDVIADQLVALMGLKSAFHLCTHTKSLLKRNLHTGSKFSSLRVDPFSKGKDKQFARVVSHVSVSLRLDRDRYFCPHFTHARRMVVPIDVVCTQNGCCGIQSCHDYEKADYFLSRKPHYFSGVDFSFCVLARKSRNSQTWPRQPVVLRYQ